MNPHLRTQYIERIANALPVHGRQIPAKKNGSLSARSNHRHSTAPLGVFLSGSEKAIAGTMQRCSRSRPPDRALGSSKRVCRP